MTMKKEKRVSQETFDETVKENMDDFDMPREEAIADAIEQFKMQVALPSSHPHSVFPFYGASPFSFSNALCAASTKCARPPTHSVRVAQSSKC